jgi:hypothetical protein
MTDGNCTKLPTQIKKCWGFVFSPSSLPVVTFSHSVLLGFCSMVLCWCVSSRFPLHVHIQFASAVFFHFIRSPILTVSWWAVLLSRLAPSSQSAAASTHAGGQPGQHSLPAVTQHRRSSSAEDNAAAAAAARAATQSAAAWTARAAQAQQKQVVHLRDSSSSSKADGAAAGTARRGASEGCSRRAVAAEAI